MRPAKAIGLSIPDTWHKADIPRHLSICPLSGAKRTYMIVRLRPSSVAHDPNRSLARIEIPQCNSRLRTLRALSFRWARRRPHPIQNISGLPQGRDQPFGGTLIVR
jgi:hypothetical protein